MCPRQGHVVDRSGTDDRRAVEKAAWPHGGGRYCRPAARQDDDRSCADRSDRPQLHGHVLTPSLAVVAARRATKHRGRVRTDTVEPLSAGRIVNPCYRSADFGNKHDDDDDDARSLLACRSRNRFCSVSVMGRAFFLCSEADDMVRQLLRGVTALPRIACLTASIDDELRTIMIYDDRPAASAAARSSVTATPVEQYGKPYGAYLKPLVHVIAIYCKLRSVH